MAGCGKGELIELMVPEPLSVLPILNINVDSEGKEDSLVAVTLSLSSLLVTESGRGFDSSGENMEEVACGLLSSTSTLLDGVND
jgi:hypothetical protein